jgi:pimeloyl-ACP methyl ester carboxylesterase
VTISDPPVLLVHGQPGSAADFEPLRSLLTPSRMVLAPDRPGWGASEEPAGGFAHNAAAMVRLLDAAEVDRALVVGYSWGGGVALALGEEHDARVTGLVLLSSVGPRSLGWMDRVPLLPGVGAPLTAGGFAMARAALSLVGLARRIPRVDASAHGDSVDALRRSVEGRRAATSFLVEQRALFDELDPIVSRLAHISAPTIVLAGDRDRLVPVATASALADAIPSAQLRVVAGARHLLPVFAPDEVARAVADVEGLGRRA